ncbi:organic cation transporter protein-like isoform X2 [Ptychodera flava]
MAETDSWCRVQDAHIISFTFCPSNDTMECVDLVKNLTIPKEESSEACGVGWKYSQCYRYNVTTDEILYSASAEEDWLTESKTIKCDHGWEYDRSQYTHTATQQFDLVCDRYYLNALLPSIAFVGILVGSVTSGLFLDRFGRLQGLIWSLLLLQVLGIAMAFSPNFAFFAVCNFLLFVVAFAIYLAGFVLVTEHVGPSKRPLAGQMIPVCYSVGYMLLSVFAYFIRDWSKLQLAITIPNAIFLLYWWIIPESPRWLLSMGKFKQAERIIRKSAKINKVQLPDDLFDGSWKPEPHEKTTIDTTEDGMKPGMLNLIRLPNMRKKTLILICNFTANSMVYYGLNLNTSSLGGSDYLSAFISAAVEIPAYLMPIYLLEVPYVGRRWSLCGTMVLSGCGCIGAAFVPQCVGLTWLRITLAMIGKFGISSSFSIVYIYAAELFPTPVRSIGIGLCSMFASLGAILSPQILLLDRLWLPLPPVIFGVITVMAGVLVLPLPETRNRKLPETMEEGEQFGKKQRPNRYKGYGQIRKVLNSDFHDTNNGMQVELVDVQSEFGNSED